MADENVQTEGITDDETTETAAEETEAQADNAEADNNEGQKASGETETQEKKAGATTKGETILGKQSEGTAEVDFKSIVPEGMQYDEGQAAAFASVAKEAGLNNEQMSQMAAYGMKYMQDAVSAVQEAQQKEIDNWGAQAKAELGKDFDTVLAKAGSGIESLEKQIPNLRQALNETGAGNRIEIIRMMAMVGELTGEDSFRGFGSASRGPANLYPKTNFDAY